MPYDPDRPPPIAAQTCALRALLHLTDLHPDLPGAYVVTHNVTPNQIDVQLNAPSDWETWRETLNLPTDTATSRSLDNRQLLECVTTVGEMSVRVYAVFPRTEGNSGEQS
jgi:hypothetical protein